MSGLVMGHPPPILHLCFLGLFLIALPNKWGLGCNSPGLLDWQEFQGLFGWTGSLQPWADLGEGPQDTGLTTPVHPCSWGTFPTNPNGCGRHSRALGMDTALAGAAITHPSLMNPAWRGRLFITVALLHLIARHLLAQRTRSS